LANAPASILVACLFGAIVRGAEPASGPVDLFKGRDLAGWEYIAGEARDISEVVTTKDGVISVAGKPNGYLVTRASYADYTLHAEWRWISTSPTPVANGGILVNIASGPVQQNLWPTSFQVQLKVQRAGDILSMGEAKFAETPTTPGTGASPSSTLARQADASEKALGEWNRADITVRGAAIDVVINGVTQNRLTQCVPASGRIGFQLEGHAFELRNVTLVRLRVPPDRY
jgi:hypothetical protein